MNSAHSTEDQREHFVSLLRTFRSAMLVTTGDGQSFHARPMAIAEVEPDGKMWFLTAAESGKVHEIEADSHVCVTAQSDSSTFVSLSGRAVLMDDPRKISELWQEPFKVWFPKGKNDPSLELIGIRPERGEYWDNTGLNRAVYMWEAAKAYVTGSVPEVKEGRQHGAVAL